MKAAVAVALFAVLPLSSRSAGESPALYASQCASCHGGRGQGSTLAPPLIGKSAADIHLMLDTGRMPASAPSINEIGRAPRLTPAQMLGLVRYVQSFAPGAADTSLPRVVAGKPARGRALFAQNCAQCHGSVGDGASVGYGNVAPSLDNVSAFQVAEAVRAGPGVMPRFGPDVLRDRDVGDIASYLQAVRTRAAQPSGTNPGGFPLAHAGPVAEGFVAWLFGLGALVLFVRRIGSAGDDA